MQTLAPLMMVPLLVWVAVWVYLWSLDAKVKRLTREIQRLNDGESEDT